MHSFPFPFLLRPFSFFLFLPRPFTTTTTHRYHPPPPLAENCTKDNFPLVFSDVSLEIRPTPDDSINLPFLRRFLPKLEYSALVSTARDLGFGEDKLPDRMPRSLIIGAEEDVAEEGEEMNISSEDEEAFLRQLWHVLMEVSMVWEIETDGGCGCFATVYRGQKTSGNRR